MIKNYLRQYWLKHLESIDPFFLHLKQTIKTCISGSIAALIGFPILHLPANQIIWLLLSSIFVSQMYRGNSLRQRFLTPIIGGCLTAILVFINAYLGNYFILYLALMFVLTLGAFLLVQFGMDIFIPALSVLIIALFSGGMPCSNIHDGLIRAALIIIGSALAVSIANILWPFRPEDFIKKNLMRSFTILADYLEFVMHSSLCGNFHRLQQYEYKNRVIQHLQSCRNLVAQKPTLQNQEILTEQLRLFAQIIALSDILSKPNNDFTIDKIESLSPDFSNIAANIAKIYEYIDSEQKQKALKIIKEQIINIQIFLNTANTKSACLYDITIINYILNKIYESLASIAKNSI